MIIIIGFIINVALILRLRILIIHNPLIIRYLVVFISCTIALQLSLVGNIWFRYLIILVFSGGIMILIIYVSRLASNINTPFFFSKGKLFLTLIVFVLPMGIFFTECIYEKNKSSFPHIFSLNEFFVLCWILAFLLFGIFLIVSLVNKSKGALR